MVLSTDSLSQAYFPRHRRTEDTYQGSGTHAGHKAGTQKPLCLYGTALLLLLSSALMTGGNSGRIKPYFALKILRDYTNI